MEDIEKAILMRSLAAMEKTMAQLHDDVDELRERLVRWEDNEPERDRRWDLVPNGQELVLPKPPRWRRLLEAWRG